MNWLRKKRNRMIASLMAVMLVCGFLGNSCKSSSNMLAWWGVLYPKFCMVEAKSVDDKSVNNESVNDESMNDKSEDDKSDSAEENGRGFYRKDGVRISFWLAKVLDW